MSHRSRRVVVLGHSGELLLPPPLSAQAFLPYEEPYSRFPTLLCPFLLPVLVSFARYDFAF